MSGTKPTKVAPQAALNRIIRGKTFTFIVGAQGVQYDVHLEAMKAISEPRNCLMTNGKMEESIKGKAILPEVEPEIFEQMVKFAYLGICGMADGLADDIQPAVLSLCRCHSCSGNCDYQNTLSCYPYCSNNCKSSFDQYTKTKKRVFHISCYCIHPDCGAHMPWLRDGNLFCSDHQAEGNKVTDPKMLAGKINLDTFNELDYFVPGLSHTDLTKTLQAHRDANSFHVPLIHHAKVYALATQYLVSDLRYISLFKLHRHLGSLEVKENNIDELADLLTFTYTNTEDGGDILKGKIDPLRNLVIIYIAEHSEMVLKFSRFREILDAGGPHTADFMALKFV